jgi:hypothetical protein
MRSHCLLIIVQGVEIFTHRSGLSSWSLPIDAFGARKPSFTIRISLNKTRIYRESFASNQPFIHTTLNHRLEHEPQQLTVAKSAMAILRKRRVLGHLVFQTQSAEPSIRQIQVNLFADSTL